ncbi:hypothetical protein HF673_16710 [Acidithiobacillus thiooxidans]|jgi:hypothetical protein|uniref:Uncharacterized protein n=1 Tax=Acidithiobacillus thiooxidans ATCC 19377 TaxID=637390 RepID=A0A5P9XTS4_ACITH|nr:MULTISPECIES: hypothetical protein [Acidithiobacillus]MBU2743189.1 hypothetical protein [Acidithiobacillus albertensis]MBU2837343.1 hypothetical protein [Acidithiobacillus thiooxidans]MBU2841148.1 hypothetical protein [Acidithiobacillus thiooxidans]MDA8175854.1 hypothetical protein [Acidithiobacillus sp.]QFX97455.1 hypothetical protein GCD22_03383 [Acidithiobacillus thiooxidans ATCC 19377]
MPVELSPVVPLLAGLDAKQRETSLSVGASVHHPEVCAMLYGTCTVPSGVSA